MPIIQFRTNQFDQARLQTNRTLVLNTFYHTNRMIVKNLANVPFNELIDCFLRAFENYYVKMPNDLNYYQERWKMAKVDFNFSYGMFDKEKLVGFVIHAVDKRDGILTAFNTGTGVLPEYRGRKIVKSIYNYALEDLKRNGFERSTLEVITKNEPAIRSYKSIGFEIFKKYKCFHGPIKTNGSYKFDLKEIDIKTIVWENLPNQHLYSWDNQKESILGGNHMFFQVLNHNIPESYFIIRPDRNYLAQFDLINTENKGWNRLFSAIKQISETIKINNVDERLKDKIDHLNMMGLENHIDQYEMELKI